MAKLLDNVAEAGSALAARVRLLADGRWPVPPLEDGRDLWADEDRDGLVFAYTRAGGIRCVMTRYEYDVRRELMAEAARKLAAAAEDDQPKQEKKR